MSIIDLDELHATLAADQTPITGLDPGAFVVRFWSALARCHRGRYEVLGALPQYGATEGELGSAMTIGKIAEIADFV